MNIYIIYNFLRDGCDGAPIGMSGISLTLHPPLAPLRLSTALPNRVLGEGVCITLPPSSEADFICGSILLCRSGDWLLTALAYQLVSVRRAKNFCLRISLKPNNLGPAMGHGAKAECSLQPIAATAMQNCTTGEAPLRGEGGSV